MYSSTYQTYHSYQTFSSSVYPTRVRIYRFTREQYYQHFREFIRSDQIMAQTFLDDEVTVFKFTGTDDDVFQGICETYDPREYHVINIHEDMPGIDHIGIVHQISGYFVQAMIPLLYINTFAYNLILVSDEHIERALAILREISNLSP